MGRVVSALPITISPDPGCIADRRFPACSQRERDGRVTRRLTLHLEEFSQEALQGYAKEHRDSPGSVVRLAALYWLADRESGRSAWRFPRFQRGAGGVAGGVRVGVDDDIWHALEDEAARQGVDAELLAEHAVLYFLADLDSGRLASRLGELTDPDKAH
jgi:hypothetical protein